MTDKQKVLDLIKKEDVKIVDIRFIDFIGTWQHFSVPAKELNEESLEDGFGFDGSSIRGWQEIHNSDMLLLPDPKTCKIDPFFKEKTLVIIGNVVDPMTRVPYSRDPRYITQKAENYLKSTGIGDTIFVGPEAEFFIFDNVAYNSSPNFSFYEIDSVEGDWNTGRDEQPNLGYKIRKKHGYFPTPPTDKFQDLRTEMLLTLESLGLDTECQHHEVATAGQAEIDLRFKPMLEMADSLIWFKYVLKNTAQKYGHTVTFMPKPMFDDNGTGMHTHLSIWKDNKPVFAGDKYAGVSETALYAIGGLLKHCKSLCAFTNPTTNSYKRLVPGFEAPINLAYSSRNRSASIRIPMYSDSPKAKRIEFRTPDPSCNGYLAFPAMLMAMLDGIENKIDPGDPLDKNIYDLPPEELKNIPAAPGSLQEALESLEKDHDFLLKGDVFTKDLIDKWIEYKMENEVKPVISKPHPHEFLLYYDI